MPDQQVEQEIEYPLLSSWAAAPFTVAVLTELC